MSYSIKNKFLSKNHISLAYPGNSIDNWYLYLDKLIELNICPDTIIIESGNHVIQSRRQGASPVLGHVRYLNVDNVKFLGLFSSVKIAIHHIFPFLTKNTPIAIKHHFKKQNNNESIKTNRELLDFKQSNDSFKNDSSLIQSRINVLYNNPDSNLIIKYNQLIKKIKDNDIYVIGINFPVHSYIRQYQDSLLEKNVYFDKFFDLTSYENDSVFSDIDHIKLSYSNLFCDSFMSLINE
tara:strand:+ start:175 stop:885 length:711 start_codon:yes stop_codon:yes gene_type:complete